MERVIFVGYGVYIQDISSDKYKVTFLLAGSPRTGPYVIDLRHSPSGHGDWNAIDVDDQASLVTGGATRIPIVEGKPEGILYVSQRYLQSANPPFSFPPYGHSKYKDRPYEFMSVQYSSASSNNLLAGHRYYGFHGKWIDGDRRTATIAVWDGGTSMDNVAPKTKVVDLDDVEQVHPDDNELMQVLRPNVGGAIFLNCRTAMNTQPTPLSIPKLPAVLSGFPIDNCYIPRKF